MLVDSEVFLAERMNDSRNVERSGMTDSIQIILVTSYHIMAGAAIKLKIR
jgi:hypothetical protein